MLIIIVSILIGLLYASLLYLFNKQQHYGKALTTLLFVLRAVVVTIVVLLFFNPFFRQKINTIEQPVVIIAQDNSSSLILSKDSVFYKNNYPQHLDSLRDALKNSFQLDEYLFGSNLRDFDKLDFKDHYTDISEALNSFRRLYYKRNVGAVVLLSDGIYNKGVAPEINLESYPFPIYTVTLGDTISYADFSVRDVRYNKTVPSNTSFPVRAVVNAQNAKGENMEITLKVDNEVVEELTIPVNSNRFSKTLDFNLESGVGGAKQIDIQVTGLKDEAQTLNNHKRFFVEVIDQKYKVLCYAKSPHPDIAAIKNSLGDRFDFETVFSGEEIPELKDFNLIILHQIPFNGMKNADALSKALADNKHLPVFYIVGPATDYDAFNKMQSALNLKPGAVNAILDIKSSYNPNFGLFTVIQEVKEVFEAFPPLALPHSELTFNAQHDDLLFMDIMNVKTQAPLLSFASDASNRKMAFLLGTGIWRWKLYDYYQHKSSNSFEEVFSKSINYLLADKDKELNINFKDSYFSNEAIIFDAELRNPSMELINEPELSLRIVNKHNKEVYEYVFTKTENAYRLNIGLLPEGVYTFYAQAENGGVKYNAQGSFSVISVGAEAQELTADKNRMQLIAQQTNGKNYNVNEFKHLTEQLKKDNRITSVEREEIRFEDLIHLKSLFFIILILITIEWLLRKIFGTY